MPGRSISDTRLQLASTRPLGETDGDVDTILQVGANVCLLRLAATLAEQFSKPVIAINAAVCRHALPANGIDDKLDRF